MSDLREGYALKQSKFSLCTQVQMSDEHFFENVREIWRADAREDIANYGKPVERGMYVERAEAWTGLVRKMGLMLVGYCVVIVGRSMVRCTTRPTQDRGMGFVVGSGWPGCRVSCIVSSGVLGM